MTTTDSDGSIFLPGQELHLSHLRLRVIDQRQRNWSRVGTARSVEGNELFFIKQFVGRSGICRPELLGLEVQGARLADELLGDLVDVLQPVGVLSEQHALVYPHVAMEPVDEALRAGTFDPKVWVSLFGTLAEICARLQLDGWRHFSDLPRKRNDAARKGAAVNFKGLEVRNIGIRRRAGETSFALFDLGAPYIGPMEEQGARLLASVALLGWGRPMSLFVQGPPKQLVDQACRSLHPYVDARAFARELDLQYQQRTNLNIGSGIRAELRKWALRIIGRNYIDRIFREWL